MPIPGPRNQFGPDPGYRNPGREAPTRFNHWERPGPVWWPGRTPGQMFHDLRGNILAPGTIRKFWKVPFNLNAAQAPFSWTRSAPGAGGTVHSPDGYFLTRPIRYMTRMIYFGGGSHSRFDAIHTTVVNQNVYKTVTVNHGQKRNQPTVRNRMTSFGARVPTLNQAADAADSQTPGSATQS